MAVDFGFVADTRGEGGQPGGRSPKDTFITIYGRMPVLEVLRDPGLRIDKVLVADNARGESLDRILGLARRRGIPVRTATPHRVKVLAGNGKQDQGVLADVIAPRMRTLEEFARGAAEREGRCHVLVLDGVSNPANVGMIIRTAAAAGMAGVVLPRSGSPGIDPLVVKASAGVAFRAPVIRCRTGAEAAAELGRAGFAIYGLAGSGRASLYGEEIPDRAAFVLGNETAGVTAPAAERVGRWLSIPMAGGVESLNVSAAAAVVCFELARRAAGSRDRGGQAGRGIPGHRQVLLCLVTDQPGAPVVPGEQAEDHLPPGRPPGRRVRPGPRPLVTAPRRSAPRIAGRHHRRGRATAASRDGRR
jgi:23S rRNA (guanosine2251-2'-O)-methyltransferase